MRLRARVSGVRRPLPRHRRRTRPRGAAVRRGRRGWPAASPLPCDGATEAAERPFEVTAPSPAPRAERRPRHSTTSPIAPRGDTAGRMWVRRRGARAPLAGEDDPASSSRIWSRCHLICASIASRHWRSACSSAIRRLALFLGAPMPAYCSGRYPPCWYCTCSTSTPSARARVALTWPHQAVARMLRTRWRLCSTVSGREAHEVVPP